MAAICAQDLGPWSEVALGTDGGDTSLRVHSEPEITGRSRSPGETCVPAAA
jgi:hypothetical protein